MMKNALQYFEGSNRKPVELMSGKDIGLTESVKEEERKEMADEKEEVGWTVRGSPASPGVIEGPATVITDHRDFIKVKTGTILLCPYASPALTTIFPKVKGLVTDTGGLLSLGHYR